MDLGRAAGKGGEKLLFSLQVLLALAALCSCTKSRPSVRN